MAKLLKVPILRTWRGFSNTDGGGINSYNDFKTNLAFSDKLDNELPIHTHKFSHMCIRRFTRMFRATLFIY